ncbi:MAG: DNA polymerase I [Spirochaetaceae bacterium]|jgi:DNA polymerase-1|nr:DNA polymerase I [Spirochaetaceae bacterium]
MKAVYLIDAYSLVYRWYFVFYKNPLRNSRGNNISALMGFARTIVKLLDDGALITTGAQAGTVLKPHLMAAVFDSHTPTFRHQQYPAYKATRNKAPADLHEQVAIIEEFLSALGVPIVRMEGYEADDSIATLTRQAQREGRQVYIFSSDKDLLQLLEPGTYQVRSVKENGYELLDADSVKTEWGVTAQQIGDLLALAGDTSDNIPGAPGIGDKTAVKLLARYGSIDEIYRNLAGITGAAARHLAAGRESVYMSRSLVKLVDTLPLPPDLEAQLSLEQVNREKGASILLREDIRHLAKQLSSTAEAAPARTQSQTDPALLGAGSYRTILTAEELAAFLAQARAQKVLALDFETDSLDAWHARPVGISLALVPKEAVYVPVMAHAGTAPFLEPEQVKKMLMPLLADPSLTIVCHNAKYDYAVSRAWGVERWRCRLFDTMVASWLVDPERNSYSLDSLASSLLGYSPVKFNDIVPQGATFDCVALEDASRYSAEDADLSLRLKALMEPRLESCRSLFYDLEMPLVPILSEMEGVGIKIEPESLAHYGTELTASLEDIQDAVFRLVGHEFNLASPQQLQKVLFEERGLKPGKKTAGGYSTDGAVLEELVKDDPLAELILRYRSRAKLKSTYIDALIQAADSESRIHTSFIQTGTATGRLSSRNPNLQNIPVRTEEGRRIRQAFVAPEGSVLISADYNQIELAVLAHLSHDPNLVAAFREGADVHRLTAALIFGLSEEAVTDEQRRIAKTINFGVIYGMGAFKLSRTLGIHRSEADTFISAYFKTYAGVRGFLDDLIRETEESGFVSTIFGRRRSIPLINSVNKIEKASAERVAFNTPIQGSAADIVKKAMLAVDDALEGQKGGARLLLQVHDELILECPQAAAEQTAYLVQEKMEQAVQLTVPLRVTIKQGKHWG